jgi:large subunit ribosomal protein L22
MEATVREKYIRMSPIKVRRVSSLIKDKNVEEALNILDYTPKRSTIVLKKALESAVANFFARENAPKVTPGEIYIKKITVDSGPILRRFRPMSMGRVGRIRRRTSHITIVIEDRN